MQVELIGCTSVGKSTFARQLLNNGEGLPLTCVLAAEYVRPQAFKGCFRNAGIDRLSIHFAAARGCFARRRSTWQIARFCRQALNQASIPPWQRWNQLRKVLKQIGLCQQIRRTDRGETTVLADEGSLHSLHNLFVHLHREFDPELARTFVELSPLPDIVIYLRQDEATLVDRIMQRGHPRIPASTPREAILQFVRSAQNAFDVAVMHPRIADRVAIIERGRIQRMPLARLPEGWETLLLQICEGADRREPVRDNQSVDARETKQWV